MFAGTETQGMIKLHVRWKCGPLDVAKRRFVWCESSQLKSHDNNDSLASVMFSCALQIEALVVSGEINGNVIGWNPIVDGPLLEEIGNKTALADRL